MSSSGTESCDPESSKKAKALKKAHPRTRSLTRRELSTATETSGKSDDGVTFTTSSKKQSITSSDQSRSDDTESCASIPGSSVEATTAMKIRPKRQCAHQRNYSMDNFSELTDEDTAPTTSKKVPQITATPTKMLQPGSSQPTTPTKQTIACAGQSDEGATFITPTKRHPFTSSDPSRSEDTESCAGSSVDATTMKKIRPKRRCAQRSDYSTENISGLTDDDSTATTSRKLPRLTATPTKTRQPSNSQSTTPTKQNTTCVVASKNFIYVFGGDVPVVQCGTIACYDIRKKKWTVNNGRMTVSGRGSAVAWFGAKIFVCGGYHNYRSVKSVYIYIPGLEIWTSTRSMLHGRSYFGLIEYKNTLYAVGGYHHEDKALKSTETFVDNNWKAGPSLKKERYGCGIAVRGDQLYVAGGESSAGLKSIERLDKSDVWVKLKPMNNALMRCALLVINDYIFAVGRQDDDIISISCYNCTEDKWTETSQLPKEHFRRNATFTADKSCIYIIGGRKDSDDTSKAVSQVDAYNVQTKEWLALQSLPKGRHGVGALVINRSVNFAKV